MRTALWIGAVVLMWLGSAGAAAGGEARGVIDEHHNGAVTALVEDCESLRLALGAAWDDALECRALSGYLRPWTTEDSRQEAEAVLRRGAALYERLKCVDDGISSVRLLRDARDPADEAQLLADLKFWRNELALAAGTIAPYAAEAATLRESLRSRLGEQAAQRKITARRAEPKPWADPQREAWRRAGASVGVRLPLDPSAGSYPEWWNQRLSVTPHYIAARLRSAGAAWFTDETPLGAWGLNCPARGQYDWTRLDRVVRGVRDCGGKILLELPTLTPWRTAEQAAALRESQLRQNQYLLPTTRSAVSLPADMAQDARASLIARSEDGTLRPQGGVQLFDAGTAAAYGEYLAALAAHLKSQGLYESVAAVHLEAGDSAELPEDVDYSNSTRQRWQAFLKERYGEVAALNRAAGTAYASFGDIPIPHRTVPPRAAGDWEEYLAKLSKQPKKGVPSGNEWVKFLMDKHRPAAMAGQDPELVREQTLKVLRERFGDDYQDGYRARLPHDYAPDLKMDYLAFRRAWVREYLAVKRRLVEAAFADKLIIAETWQTGDHDGVQGKSERRWGGFTGEDFAQFTSTGPGNERRPFMLRSIGPVGFGTRVSDGVESLYRDYLWLHFTDPGNLTRYFYHWVAHGYLDYQLGWHSVTNHWLTNRVVSRIGPTVANTAPRPQRIGMLMPRTTLDLFDGASYYPYMGWDWVLGSAKLPCTRIDEQLVREGGLRGLGLEALILPEAAALDDRVAAGIAQWVADGGLLIASGIPGRLDGRGASGIVQRWPMSWGWRRMGRSAKACAARRCRSPSRTAHIVAAGRRRRRAGRISRQSSPLARPACWRDMKEASPRSC